MKYAFMSFSAPAASLDELLAMAAEYGYDGVEPRIDSDHAHGIEVDLLPDERQAVLDLAEETGIAICCIATSCRLADPEVVQEMLPVAHDAIDLAGDLKCPCIRVFGGAVRKGLRRDQSSRMLAGALSQLGNHAAERGVTVCLETHDDWCDPRHVAAVLEKVAHPNIAVNWDIMHPVRAAGVTMDEAFEALQPWIRHVHVHDGACSRERLEFRPIGEGDIDHRTAVRLLRESGYEGFLSGEWINWTPAEEHLPTERQTLRQYESEIA